MSTTSIATLEVGSAVAPSPGEVVQVAPGPRRFAWYASAAVAIASIPYLWVLWDLWSGGISALRSEPFDSNFYDLQARAILGGHLYLKNGAIGIEAFVHDGHQYTYFGVLPSLLRMPILAVTHSLDGKLTAPAILTAWLITALFSSLLVWRVRVLARGGAALGRAEAAGLGVLVGTITGGSVLVYLASTPWVFDEDFAWSVAMTVGSLFALLGLLERPSRGRALLAGVLLLATSLTRAPAGYGCEIAALLIAVWFFLGRGGRENRRWGYAALAVGLVPLVIAGAINTAKFGSPFALPMADQVWTSINAHRSEFLAANGGEAFSFAFLPSTFLAYAGPAGVHFSTVFPFVTLPTTPAHVVGGAFLDQEYPTESMTVTMPLLFGFGLWGVVTAFRPKPVGSLALTRLPLVGAALACSGALLWGYIAPRYLADFLPLLILSAAVGMVDVWRRLEGRRRPLRLGALAAIAAAGAYCVAANVLLSITPIAHDAWSTTQLANYISAQNRISDVTGHPLAGTVVRGAVLPYFAPAGELFDVGNCQGLYLSTGYEYQNVPDEEYEHWTWLPVEEGPTVVHRLSVVFSPSLASTRGVFQVLDVGDTGIIARVARVQPDGKLLMYLGETDPHIPSPGHPLAPGVVRVHYSAPALHVVPGRTYVMTLVADPSLGQLALTMGGVGYLEGPMTGSGPLDFNTSTDPAGLPLISMTRLAPGAGASISLCQSLTSG